MNKRIDIEKKLNELTIRYSSKYFIFIAPYNLNKCTEYKIFDYYVPNNLTPDFSLFEENEILGIYFMTHQDIHNMKFGKPVTFKRLSDPDIFDKL